MFKQINKILPRGLFGRAALILVVPVITIQLVVSIVFIQRHFERVTRQMTDAVVIEIEYVLGRIAAAPDAAAAHAEAKAIAKALEFKVDWTGARAQGFDESGFFDVPGQVIIATLREGVPGIMGVELLSDPGRVRASVSTAYGPVVFELDRRRLSASNPHQLLVLMILTSIFMTLIAFMYLRKQLRPITKLAEAAAAFGRGNHVPYRPRGAVEVRQAGTAFLEMRNRIERQIEQRTLMLSGISHDLRTPLTRMKLGLSMLPDDEDTRALLADVTDMQRLVDEFLSFARGDAMEVAEVTDPHQLAARVIENAQRAGQQVTPGVMKGRGMVLMRPTAVTRALENLIGNAVRYGTRAELSVVITERGVRFTVADDGPGIPEGLRDEAVHPFARLDAARDPNRGGGVGLGLSIAADIARNHGGVLRLGKSETLGGLRADLLLAR